MARVHKKMIKNIIKAEMKKKKAPKADVDKVISTIDKLDIKTLNTLFASPATVAQFMKDPTLLEQYVKEDAKPEAELETEADGVSEDEGADAPVEEGTEGTGEEALN